MAVGELFDLFGWISSSDVAIVTFRRTGRVFVIVHVAIYIARCHRRAGADDGLEGSVLERTLNFDASADR